MTDDLDDERTEPHRAARGKHRWCESCEEWHGPTRSDWPQKAGNARQRRRVQRHRERVWAWHEKIRREAPERRRAMLEWIRQDFYSPGIAGPAGVSYPPEAIPAPTSTSASPEPSSGPSASPPPPSL